MKWYDRIAGLYDFFTEWVYKKPRKQLVESLGIERGDRVLVIACGTGQSFGLIEKRIGKEGEIIAVDFSEGMLARAKRRAEKHNWQNIKLIHKDLREVNAAFFERESIKCDFDFILAELAFSVIPDWQSVMETCYSMLKKGGKMGLLDWYRSKNDFLTKPVNFWADADISRNTLNHAEKVFGNIEIKGKYFFKNIYIAIAER